MANTIRHPTVAVSDFGPRLRDLQQLQREAKDAYRAAAGAILKFAIEYAALWLHARASNNGRRARGN
jgi:hypothetical protein